MTKNEGRRYWQVPQITASDKEGHRRRSPFNSRNKSWRSLHSKKIVKLYMPPVKSKKNSRYSPTKTSAKTTRSVKQSSRRGVRTPTPQGIRTLLTLPTPQGIKHLEVTSTF